MELRRCTQTRKDYCCYGQETHKKETNNGRRINGVR